MLTADQPASADIVVRGAYLEVGALNIADLIGQAITAHPDRVAMNRAGTAITFRDLAEIAAGGARVLIERGAWPDGASAGKKAGHVVYLGVGSPAYPVAMFSAAYAGVPLTPLNYRRSTAQVAELVARLEAPVVLADPETLADPAFIAAMRAAGRDVLDTDSFVDAAIAARTAPPESSTVDNDAPAVILFTSGTTATPKGVVLTHSNLSGLVATMGMLGVAPPGATGLVCVPPYHIMGVMAVLSAVYAGRRLLYLPAFEPGAWLSAVAEEKVTSATLVPTMLARIVNHLGDAVADAPTLLIIAYGGAKMPRPVLERAMRAFPTTGFANSYGLTETSASVTVLTPDEHRAALASDDPAVRARLGSAGRCLPGIELQVRDELGTPLPSGVTGELWIRGDQVSRAYLGLGSALDPDGWFPTRDRGHLDEEGYLFVEGRSDDTIIRGGENIAPAEIEDVLFEHPAVRAVAVVGLPDEEWGERTAAVVVLEPGAAADADELKAFVRAQLRGSRTPDDVYFRDELPTTDTGKVQRRVLVAELS
jgi:acyl-CoA synthetase (AMP-forming)/AMP-acid ligase II